MDKEVAGKSPAELGISGVHLYAVHDPIPVPEASESDTDTAWALWEDSLSAQSRGPATNAQSTVPAKLPSCLFSNSLKRND